MNNYPSSPAPPKHNSPSSSSQTNSNAPIYIQNPTYNSVNNSIYSGSQGSSMDSGETTPHASMESIPPPPPHLIGQANGEKATSVKEAIKSLTEKNHHPVSPHMIRRANSLRQPGEECNSNNSRGDNKEISRSTPTSRRGSNVESNVASTNNKSRSNLIQTLNQKLVQHTIYATSAPATGQQNGGGHVNLQNNYSSSPPNQSQPIYQQLTPNQQQQQQQQYAQSQAIYSQVYQQQQQAMSPQPIYQQIHTNNQQQQQSQLDGFSMFQSANGNANPRNQQQSNNSPRRFSEELLKTTASFVQNRVLGSKTPPPLVTSKEIFVQTLNAKLSQMRNSPPPTDHRKNSYPFSQSPHSLHHHHHQQQPPPNPKPTSFASKLVASVSSHQKGNSVHEISRAFRVRQWISSKTVSDPTMCRESLLEQIRRGTHLKPARTVNDRSAPKIYH